MSTKPVQIDQVIPTIVERDAVSHHTLEVQQVLRALGFVSEIYALNIGPGMADRVRPLDDLTDDASGRQWLCYQASIGSPAAEVFAAHPGPKLLNYHNITPAPLVERWMPALGEEVRLGRDQLARLASQVPFAIGDSEYNTEELEAWGYKNTATSMLMIDRTNFDVPADRRRRRRLASARSRGGADWLYVGQFLPHKAHHEVVMAFDAYRRVADPAARLHLVGRESCPAYALAVRKLVAARGLEGSVDFAGSVPAAALAALYECCDVFVSCSEHEGYCAPLLEAMHHGLPFVAYGAGAVPETAGDAGIVLDSKEPLLVAAAVAAVLEDRSLREALATAGRQRAASFTLDRARGAFAETVDRALVAVDHHSL